jgi:hypothetical protein
MPTDAFPTTPGYLEYASHTFRELNYDPDITTKCHRLEVREFRAEFHVVKQEYFKQRDYGPWYAGDKEIVSVHANKPDAVGWVKDYVTEFAQAAQEDLEGRIDVLRRKETRSMARSRYLKIHRQISRGIEMDR